MYSADHPPVAPVCQKLSHIGVAVPHAKATRRLSHTIRLACVLLVILFIQGCTNSKFIIGPLYNRIDDKMREELNEMGEFTEEQRAAFEATVGTFHVWHRQSELPQYAELMRDIAASVKASDTTADDIQRWMDTAEMHTRSTRQCLPVNFLASAIQTLSDEQIEAIQTHVDRERAENRQRYASRTPEERVKRRIRNTVKWTNRLGIGLTPTQRAMFLSTYKRQISLRKEYFALSDQWNRDAFDLIRNRDNPEYTTDFMAHLGELWQLLESAHPDEWQANRDLWKQTALRYVTSLTDEQRGVISPWLSKMATTLVRVSQDKPSFKVSNDPSLGCLVENDKT